MSEESLHESVCRYLAHQYSGVIFNTDMSGVRLHQGLRAKVNRLRSHRAMPDIVIYRQRQNYAGLFIELKKEGTRILLKDGSLTKDKHIREQADVLVKLRAEGYFATFTVGWEETRALIDWYLTGNIFSGIPRNYL